jgi:hypothetical protein
MRCRGPVMTVVEGDTMSTRLDVTIPVELVQEVEDIAIGEMIKVRSKLEYEGDEGRLRLWATLIEVVTSVKIVVE